MDRIMKSSGENYTATFGEKYPAVDILQVFIGPSYTSKEQIDCFWTPQFFEDNNRGLLDDGRDVIQHS